MLTPKEKKIFQSDRYGTVLYGMTDRFPLLLKITYRYSRELPLDLDQRVKYCSRVISTHLPSLVLKSDCKLIEQRMIHTPYKFWSGEIFA